MAKKDEFLEVFKDILNTNVCGEDSKKVLRDISKVNIDSRLMIIGEAMAPNQVRVSGVNFFFTDGSIGNTGRYLEKFLNKVGYSVYPKDKNCVYHTEIVHGFPGYINGKIRRPTEKEIKESIDANILQKEIALLNPKAILLMGNTAYKTFYKYILHIKDVLPLTRKIEHISETETFERYGGIPVIPIQHASGANPRFNQMIKNERYIKLLNSLL